MQLLRLERSRGGIRQAIDLSKLRTKAGFSGHVTTLDEIW